MDFEDQLKVEIGSLLGKFLVSNIICMLKQFGGKDSSVIFLGEKYSSTSS